MQKTILFLLSVLVCATSFSQTSQEKTAIENYFVDIATRAALGDDARRLCKELKVLAAKDSTNDAVQYYIGLCEAAMGNMDASETALSKACRLDPSNDEYQEQLAKIYGNNGKMSEAQKIYLSLLDRNPGKYRNAFTLTMLADSQMYMRQDSLAMTNYDAALIYDPGYAPALLGKAELFRMTGNIAAFFSQLHIFTSDPQVNTYAKCSYVNEILGHLDGKTYQFWHAQIDTIVASCVTSSPQDSSALKLAGRWFYGTGYHDKGRAYYERFRELYPEDFEAWFIQYFLHHEDEDWESCIADCRTMMTLAKGDDEKTLKSLSMMGDAQVRKGDKNAAFDSYEKALKIKSDDLTVLNNYAYYLSLEGRKLAKAEKMSRITVEKEPDNPTYLDTYGWILHLRGKDKESKTYFKHAIIYGGKENYDILVHYSEVLEALGEKDLSTYYRSLAEGKK